jgi:hypothetical protein
MKATKHVTQVFAEEPANPGASPFSLSFTHSDGAMPEQVTVRWLDEEGEDNQVTIPPVLLERAAIIVRRHRDDVGGIEVCAEHGYYESASGTYRCPKCHPVAKVSEVAP